MFIQVWAPQCAEEEIPHPAGVTHSRDHKFFAWQPPVAPTSPASGRDPPSDQMAKAGRERVSVDGNDF